MIKLRQGEGQRVIASIATFSFVALFHGIMNEVLLKVCSRDIHSFTGGNQPNVLIWVGLNWLGIMLESFSFSLNKHKYYQSIRDCIGARSERRLCAFLSTFLLIMSCISCYYFLRGIEVCILAPKIQLDTIYYFLLVCQCYCNKN